MTRNIVQELPSTPALLSRSTFKPWVEQAARLSLLFISDMSALFLSAFVAYSTWASWMLGQPLSVYFDVISLLILLPVGYAAAGLYPGFGLGAIESLRRLTYCTSFGFLALAASSFALKLPTEYSRVTFGLACMLATFLVPIFRYGALSWATGQEWWQEPAIILGDANWVRQTIVALKSARSIGYRPIAVLEHAVRIAPNRIIEGIPVLGGPELIPDLAACGVRIVIVGDQTNITVLDDLHQHFRHVVVIREYGSVPIERFRAFNLGGVLGMEFTNNLLRWPNPAIKRAIDLIAGCCLLFWAAPVILVAGALIKLRSPGPIFYCQERSGLKAKPIKIWKLRTMHPDAERRLISMLESVPELRKQWDEHLKLPSDPRIIPYVGHFLRRFSLDELPQLWNVVRGDMSLVGPRPFPDYHMERFPPEFRQFRQSVRPGLTGMWQVMVRSNGSIDEQKFYDAYYIRNWCIWLDLYLLARTSLVVATGRGAC